MDVNTIAGVADALGITHRTIRFYEEKGLLKPTRTPNRGRVFDQATVDRLSFILLLADCGFLLREIKAILARLPENGPFVLPEDLIAKRRAVLVEEKAILDRTLEALDRMRGAL